MSGFVEGQRVWVPGVGPVSLMDRPATIVRLGRHVATVQYDEPQWDSMRGVYINHSVVPLASLHE
jgi:hypothetical protein